MEKKGEKDWIPLAPRKENNDNAGIAEMAARETPDRTY